MADCMKAESKEFFCKCYVLGTGGVRLIVGGEPVITGITIKAENKRQAKRLFEERESGSHEFIEWW